MTKTCNIIFGASSTLGNKIKNFLNDYEMDWIETYYSKTIKDGIKLNLLSEEDVKRFLDILIKNKKLNQYDEINVIFSIGVYKKENFDTFSNNIGSSENGDFFQSFCSIVNSLIKFCELNNTKLHVIYISTNLMFRYNKGTYRYILEKKKCTSVLEQLAYENRKGNGFMRFNIISPGYFSDMDHTNEVKDDDVLYDLCLSIKMLIESKAMTGCNLKIERGDTLGY